ncbi:MAG: cobalamin-binding protein [Acidimicrobiales bacterium]
MRILSLLPSATEIVYALGLEDDLVGVTHECDWPPAARSKRAVSSSSLPEATEPGEVDRLVSASVTSGEPIYRLDTDAVRELAPDIVISQDLCAVCAVPSGYVNDALDVLGCRAEVISLDPGSIDEVLGCVLRIGEATGRTARASALVDDLRERLEAVDEAVGSTVRSTGRPRTFALEWSDPPFNAGHWVPQMIELAGGEAVLASPGQPSVRVTWKDVASSAPEVVVFMPCGYDLEQAVDEASDRLLDKQELAGARALFAVDASSYFSRPGPRIVDGVEILAYALHPGSVPAVPPDSLQRIR